MAAGEGARDPHVPGSVAVTLRRSPSERRSATVEARRGVWVEGRRGVWVEGRRGVWVD